MGKKEQMGGIVLAFNDALKTPEWKSTVKESTNYVGSDEAFDAYKPRIYNFNNLVYSEAKKNLPKEETVEIDFIDNEDEMGKTMFGMTMLEKADNIFGGETIEEPTPEVKEDNVSDNSFIISREELHALDNATPVVETPEVRPVDSFTEAITPIEDTEEMEGEVVSFEAEQEKAKVKTLGKKAASVDTVILCLLAQLSLFGLLIIVLLIIK